jgi:hypothetical protein
MNDWSFTGLQRESAFITALTIFVEQVGEFHLRAPTFIQVDRCDVETCLEFGDQNRAIIRLVIANDSFIAQRIQVTQEAVEEGAVDSFALIDRQYTCARHEIADAVTLPAERIPKKICLSSGSKIDQNRGLSVSGRAVMPGISSAGKTVHESSRTREYPPFLLGQYAMKGGLRNSLMIGLFAGSKVE